MTIHKHRGNFTWEKTEILKYKENGTSFKDITRQILFPGASELPGELRYFEIAPGGHSTLERHEHLHVVMVIRGLGEALIGLQVVKLDCFDVIMIPALTWHQFQANAGETLGFLCLVAAERDRPERPGADHLEHLRSDPTVAKFIRV